MKKYTIYEAHKEIRRTRPIAMRLYPLDAGCTELAEEPYEIKSFDTLKEAAEELKNSRYNAEVIKRYNNIGAYYYVTEYYIEMECFDEDGDFDYGENTGRYGKFPPVWNYEPECDYWTDEQLVEFLNDEESAFSFAPYRIDVARELIDRCADDELKCKVEDLYYDDENEYCRYAYMIAEESGLSPTFSA